MIPSATSVAALSLLLAGLTSGTLYQNVESLPKAANYDFIIVGGGAGGSVVANRLTENPSTKVLLIEAGVEVRDSIGYPFHYFNPNFSDFNNLDIEVPSFAPQLGGTQFDWNFTTLGQPGLNGRSIAYQRGFVLGGSTAVNIMAYCRGSKDDYDRWAEVTGDEGWSWNSLQPYIRKIENPVAPADHHNTQGEIDLSIHGHGGPVNFSLPGQLLPTDQRVIGASFELPTEFPFNLDYNSGDTIGIGWTQTTISNGHRVDAANSYLAPVLSRSNLDILVNTQVTKVVQTGTQRGGEPIFRGVEFASSSSGARFTMSASQEVILSAGAIKTPQILMLSGIGDSSHLSSLGVKTIVNVPDVGANLQDHPLTTISWTVRSTDTLDNVRTNETLAAELLQQWNSSHTGDLVLGPGNQLGWLRLPKDASIFKQAADPSAGPTSAHYEFIPTDSFVSFSQPFPSQGNFFTMFSNLVSPSSRGNITLNSTDPFAHPLIQPNMLSTEFDIFAMREAIKAARRFMSAQSWSDWIIEETSLTSVAQTDEEIEEYIRSTCFTVNHVTCTAPMGKTGSNGRGSGALNSDLTVKGTIGLRVVDASAFPFIPAAHTQVPTYILAERAADLIKSGL